MFPNQDLSALTGAALQGRGPFLQPLEQWPLRNNLTLTLMARGAAVDIDTLDAWIGIAHEEDQRLRAFAFVIMRLLVEGDEAQGADRLSRLLDHGTVIPALLDMPVLSGLHERLDYIEILATWGRRWLTAWERATGEMTYAAQHDLVTAVRSELLRRREAWKARLRARLERRGITREILTAIVWHPRNVERWLAAADGDAAAEDRVHAGFEVEGVGKAIVA